MGRESLNSLYQIRYKEKRREEKERVSMFSASLKKIKVGEEEAKHVCLSRQAGACHDKSVREQLMNGLFVATSTRLSRQASTSAA